MSRRYDIGVHHFLQGEFEGAARTFQEIVREEPTNAPAWSYYGMSLAHLGEGALAEHALSTAVHLAPSNSQAWFHLGVARSLREEWGDAASAYRRAVALEPGDLVAWHRLGVALAEAGDSASATAAFERALVLSREGPGRDRPLSSRIRSEAEDIHVTESGERDGGREAKSWLDLALSLLSLGEEEEAIAAYERAYTLDPTRSSKSLFRPMLRLVTAAQASAIEPPERAVPIGPSNPAPRPTPTRPTAPEQSRPEVR
jgi:Flp pilus assembly protein TadD